jgi:hypothetical protein
MDLAVRIHETLLPEISSVGGISDRIPLAIILYLPKGIWGNKVILASVQGITVGRNLTKFAEISGN